MKSMPKELLNIIDTFTPREKRLFACDCAQHILYFFTQLFPLDVRPVRAIEAARKYAFGQIDRNELEIAFSNADDASMEAVEYAVETNRSKTIEKQFVNEASGTASQAAASCCYTDIDDCMKYALSLSIETIRTSVTGISIMGSLNEYFTNPNSIEHENNNYKVYIAKYETLEDHEYKWQLSLAKIYKYKSIRL